MDPRTAPPKAAPMIDPGEGATIKLMMGDVAKSIHSYMYVNMNYLRIFISKNEEKKKTNDERD